MASPSKTVFVENVRTTDTRPFRGDAAVSASNFGYHLNRNGESHYFNGKGMGDVMVDLLTP